MKWIAILLPLKKKPLSESDFVGSIGNFLGGNIKKGLSKIKTSLKNAKNNKEEKEQKNNTFDLNTLKSDESLAVSTTKGTIYLVMKDSALYFASPKYFNKFVKKDDGLYVLIKGKPQKLDEDKETLMYELFDSNQFYLKCSIDDNESGKLVVNETYNIIIDENDTKKYGWKYIYDDVMVQNFECAIVDFKKMSFDESRKYLCGQEWYKNYRENKENKEKEEISKKSFKFDVDNKEKSVEELTKAMKLLDEFEYISTNSDGNEIKYKIVKENGNNYMILNDKKRPVIVSEEGLVVALT